MAISGHRWRQIVLGADLAFWILLAAAMWAYPVVKQVAGAAFLILILASLVASVILLIGRRRP
jgi:hypothetical protein